MKKNALLIIFMLISSCWLQAQQISISGKVIDKSNLTLPGVNIVVKETTKGVMSDIDGNFKLSNISQGDILKFSYIGYISKEVTVGSDRSITVTLEEDVQNIDEVMVVGYGSQKKSDVTAAMASVSADDLKEKPILKATDALQGKLSGVSISGQTGSPGSAPVIRIRGANSINGSNAPLVVIDGLIGGNLNTINTNDIASIEVLKDASATAIYGSRGANGVIIVSTKSGNDGKTDVEFNTFFGMQSLSKKIDLLSPVEYAQTANRRRTVAKSGDIFKTDYEPRLYYDAESMAKLESGEMCIDWQDEVYRDALVQNYQFSIRSGSPKSRFLISGNYIDQEGIIINSGYRKYSGRVKIDTDLNDFIRFGINGVFTKEDNNPANSNVAHYATYALPTGWVYKQDGSGDYFNNRESYSEWGESSPNSSSRLWNPVAQAMEAVIDQFNSDINAVSYLEFDLNSKLTVKFLGSISITDNNSNGYYNDDTTTGKYQGSVASISNSRTSSWQNSNIITYKNQFNDHSLNVTALLEQQSEKWSGNSISARGFINDTKLYHDIESAEVVLSKDSNAGESALLSYMGRVNYGYRDRYLLTAAVRGDGSSKFSENSKWGLFPSASAAWRVSEESFIKSCEKITDLKFRLSWGITGSQAISPYETLSKLQIGGSSYNYPTDGNNIVLGSSLDGMANSDLEWEKTNQTDIGIDLSLFDNRLSFVMDYYYKKTTDLLLDVSLPRYSGFSSVRANAGEVENRGWEFLVSAKPFVDTKVKWDIDFNISSNKNKVLALSIEDEDKLASSYDISYIQVGESLGSFYGYNYLGVFLYGEEDEAAKYGQTIGSTKVEDRNGNGEFDSDDRTIIGDPTPDFMYGISNRVEYKGFVLSLFLQGSQGNDIYNYSARNRFDFENTGTTGYRGKQRWHPTEFPEGYYQRYDYSSTLNNAFYRKEAHKSTMFVEDGSYLRLKNITLSYNIPSDIIKKVGMKSVRLYASGENLLTVTDYTGYDPELGASENDASAGVDNTYYPNTKTFMFGFDIKF